MILIKKLAPYIGGVLVIILILWGVYSLGSSHGKAVVQNQWDKATIAKNNEILKLKDDFAAKERDHRAATGKLSYELEKAQQIHDQDVATLRADYSERLFNSEQRGSVYKRQAEGGSVERTSLASHAAQLDRSLEEGRNLVAEFRRTLEFREDQLRLLGKQIITDRALLGEYNAEQSNSSQ